MRVLSRSGWAGDFTMKRIRQIDEQIMRMLNTTEQPFAQGDTEADGQWDSYASVREVWVGGSHLNP